MEDFKKIYKEIKKYNNIIIARHIGVDPDALASQLALRDSIRLTFPEKKVIAIGSGSAKFNFIGKLDKFEILENSLLIVLDTPDIKRIDGANINDYNYVIKIDHHPEIDKYSDLEIIDIDASSTCELIAKWCYNCNLKMPLYAAQNIFMGIVVDKN